MHTTCTHTHAHTQYAHTNTFRPQSGVLTIMLCYTLSCSIPNLLQCYRVILTKYLHDYGRGCGIVGGVIISTVFDPMAARASLNRFLNWHIYNRFMVGKLKTLMLRWENAAICAHSDHCLSLFMVAGKIHRFQMFRWPSATYNID